MLRINKITPTPEILIAVFREPADFIDWANDLHVHDLQYWLEEFEVSELYEHCCILRDLIIEKERINEVYNLYNGLRDYEV